jgi:Holliday junction DNA helicase RuvA
MYDFIRGAVVSRAADTVVLENQGVGYRFCVSASSSRQLRPGSDATLYAHTVLRDDRLEMFGFATHAERHLFLQLLQVSGVGPAAALGLLSAYEPEALASHIAAGELTHLTRVKGIGKRTGERILVELRDRFADGRATPASPVLSGDRDDAVRALCSLGLPRAEALRRIEMVRGDDIPVGELVQEALRRA